LYNEFPLYANNTIVWGNQPTQLHAQGTSPLFVAYSDVQGGAPGSGNLDASPLFRAPPQPGLDGEWGTVDDDFGDVRLLPGSPCIDRGSNPHTLNGPELDRYGQPRFIDDPDT